MKKETTEKQTVLVAGFNAQDHLIKRTQKVIGSKAYYFRNNHILVLLL